MRPFPEKGDPCAKYILPDTTTFTTNAAAPLHLNISTAWTSWWWTPTPEAKP